MEQKNNFPGFNQELNKLIARMYTRAYFEPGDIVLRPGQHIRSALLVYKGRIKICREDQNGNEFFLYHIGAGQACAYTLLLDAMPGTCKILAKAMEDTVVFLLPLASTQRWMTKYTGWNDFVLRTFHQHMNQLMQVMDLLLFKGMDERLEHYLESHRNALTNPCLQLSHQEIANEMSTSREVISRLLKKMEQKGKLKLHRNQIEMIE
jgi:CRP/FNR family transcriptional regulator